jgi:diguanylate cyclase (GGDEF)-like protein/PAS domain S-box-containing protein
MGMNWRVARLRSLKTKVTLSTLAVFLLGIWSLAWYASRVLREDMQLVLGEQQFASVYMVGADVNDELEQRFRALNDFVPQLAPTVMGQPALLQTLLVKRPILRTLFNGGFIVYRSDGVVVDVDWHFAGRLGSQGLSDNSVLGALKDGLASVGRPTMDTASQSALFPVTVPVRDQEGNLVGAVSGWTNLNTLKSMDHVVGLQSARTGEYLLIAPQHRLVVMASKAGRVMEMLPMPAVDALADYLLSGHSGYSLSRDRWGAEVLVSTALVPVAGWSVSAVLPTSVAFAPIHAMQQHMLVAALALASLAEAPQPLQPLHVDAPDEVGELIGGFNRLLESLGQREQALRDSEQRYRTMVEWSPEAVMVHARGRIIYLNPAAVAVMGAESAQQLLGTLVLDRVHPASLLRAQQHTQVVLETGASPAMVELRCLQCDGTVMDMETQSKLIEFGGARAIYTVLRDISARRKSEAELRIAATAFESQHGMLVTDGDWRILRVNQAFTDMSGYAAHEAIGQRPALLLGSGHHDAAFYDAMNAALRHSGTWQGEVWDRRKNGDVFPVWLTITAVKDEAGQVTHYVDGMIDITERKAAEEQIQRLAFFDPLTQLPNRRFLMDRLEQSMANLARYQRKGALLFVDLDNFKILNDTHGHYKGDLLLREVAQRLLACIRKGDTVARLGGDEFVVMLEDLSEQSIDAASQAEVVAEKILATLNQNFQLAGHVCHSTPSIGITLYGEQAESIEEPLKRADLAMYQAKAAGRNTLRFFDPEMQAVVSARALLEAGLREALAGQQLLLHFQPQIGGAGRLTGVEALVRWPHPLRGMVPPAEFIPLAEDSGLILPLGQWVLEAACTQLARWAQHPALAELDMAVNVSPRQFHQSDFVAQVHSILARTGARPQRLKLELTESVLVSHVEDVIAKMNALKGIGVGFSLDDFGTGYSSLSYLKRMPLEQLKIDQGFVRDILTDPNDAAIAKMIIALGGSLGLGVVAEGVETAEQCAFLARQGCHAYQGYLFSRPLPVDALEVFAQEWLSSAAYPHRPVRAGGSSAG